MARTVKDTAALFNIIVGYDEKDALTEKVKNKEKIDYTKDLSVEGLKGKKIGALFSVDQQDEERKAVAEKIKQDLQHAGAELTEEIKLNHDGIDNLPILEHDFKHNLNSFLAN